MDLPQGLPVHAYRNLPVLVNAIDELWPTFPYYSMFAAQVEKESCISLKHSKCWNEKAELKTSREYGFGLGQITITSRFNKFEELKQSSKHLRNWNWNDRFNANYQLKAVIILNIQNYNKLNFVPNEYERIAMMFSAYNGGLGSVINDRKLCDSQPNSKCDKNKWFNNVEIYSFKSKIKVSGYGESWYDINRGYVKQVMLLNHPYKRRLRYSFLDEKHQIKNHLHVTQSHTVQSVTQ